MASAKPSTTATREGHLHDLSRGITKHGLTTQAVKESSKLSGGSDYDAIVIGAGFTGLVAARDLSLAGHRVLLLEARDRIGGRTWTAQVDDHNYEMGGTWVHWLQPHVWSEITRYGLVSELKVSTGMSEEAELSYLDDSRTDIIKQRPELIDQRFLPLLAKFVDVDGCRGQTLFPQPWLPLQNSDTWRSWDISLRERADQLDIRDEDREFLLSWLAINTCSTADKSSFLNLIRLLALSGHDFNLFMDICGKYKFKDGTTHLASAMLSEFRGDVLFGRVVTSVVSSLDGVEIRTKAGETFAATQVVCTIPLHCLSDVDFSPSLPKAFTRLRHANFCGKVHLHSSVPVDPWCGMSDGNHYVIAAFTESPSTSGGTHVVTFSNAKRAQQSIESDPDAYVSAVAKDLLPKSVDLCVTHLAWHDWTSDEFARGAWASYGPRQLSAGLGEIMENDRIAPNVLLASADWAHGWVGYIDGAIEMGRKAARNVALRLVESA